MVFGDDRLPLGGVEEAQISLCHRPCPLPVDIRVNDRDRRIDADGTGRIDDLELPLRFLDLEVRFALERQMDVADPLLREGGGGGTGAGVEDRRAAVEPLHIAPRVVDGAPGGEHRSPGGEEAVLAVAGGLRIGGDDRDVVAIEVLPVGDALGVALADDEHDDRVVGHRLVVEPRLPVGLDEPRLGDGLDVGPHRERDDVGIQSVDHRPGLAPGGRVRLLDRDRGAMLRLIALGEGVIDLPVELARRVVRDVEEVDGRRLAVGSARRAAVTLRAGAAGKRCQQERRDSQPRHERASRLMTGRGRHG